MKSLKKNTSLLTKIVKDISWQKLQFFSSVLHQACYLHSELLKYKSNLVTLRFEFPMHLHWPRNEVWALCRACKLCTVQPGLPSQNPLQLLPVHPHLLPLTTQKSPKHQAVPCCCVSEDSFSLCVKFVTSMPHRLCHGPHWFILHIPLSSRLVWYSPNRIFHYCALSSHLPFYPQL